MIRTPDQVRKDHPQVFNLDDALQSLAEAYPVAAGLLQAWDTLPMSVRAALAMHLEDVTATRLRLMAVKADRSARGITIEGVDPGDAAQIMRAIADDMSGGAA